MSTVFLVRNPVFDRRAKLYGYEIRARFLAEPHSPVGAAENGSSFVTGILHAGFARLSNDLPRVTIHLPSALASHEALDMLPKDRCTFELTAESGGLEAALEAATHLGRRGFSFAIDEAMMREGGIPDPRTRYVQLRLGLDRSTLRQRIDAVRKFKLRALIDGVTTPEEFAGCSAFGFDLFRGSFFAKPQLHNQRSIPESKASLFHLLTRLQDPRVTIAELESLVAEDNALADRLLRLVNSACSGVSDRVETIRGAILVLGTERIVSLVSMVALSSLQDKPPELLLSGMIRAKMCEALAISQDRPDSEKFFSVGMLSHLEALLDQPMGAILARLPLSPDIRETLLNPEGPGPLSQNLRAVIAFEQGDWSAVEALLDEPEESAQAYLVGLDFAASATHAMAA